LLCQCEDSAKYLRPTPEDAPKKEATERSSIPTNLKSAITDETAMAETDDSQEKSHVPFVMRMPKDYEWNHLPEHISSENDGKTVPANFTDDQNRYLPIENQDNSTESRIEHALSVIVDYLTRINTDRRWHTKSGPASCMDNENTVFDFLENETSSYTSRNKNSDKVNSSENKGNELEKLLETNQLGRSHGNFSTVTEKSRNATARFKELGNVFLKSGIAAHVLTNWGWQDTFDVFITCWMINFCVIDLYLTACFIMEIIGLLR